MHPGWLSPAFVCRDRGRRDPIRQTTHVEARSGATRDGGSIPPASTRYKGSDRFDILPGVKKAPTLFMGGYRTGPVPEASAEGGLPEGIQSPSGRLDRTMGFAGRS